MRIIWPLEVVIGVVDLLPGEDVDAVHYKSCVLVHGRLLVQRVEEVHLRGGQGAFS